MFSCKEREDVRVRLCLVVKNEDVRVRLCLVVKRERGCES